MRERKNADDVVAVRLQSVLTGAGAATVDRDRPPPRPTGPGAPPLAAVVPVDPPPGPSSPGDLADSGGPLRWSDIVPGWHDDVFLEPTSAPPVSASSFPERLRGEAGTGDGDRSDGPSVDPEGSRPVALSGAGAFRDDRDGRRLRWGAFDPGRRGVRALAAVAVLVILIAAVLAWRARPRVDPVAPPSFSADTAAGSSAQPGGGPLSAAASAASEVVVAVTGRVRKPGLVRLAPGARVADALTAAGGADPGVDLTMLNLARKVVDGELILVGVGPPAGAVVGGTVAGPAGGTATSGGRINLNTATLAELDTLPGVGPVLAQRILDARQTRGGFRSVSDLRKVSGIGDARYEQLKDLVTV